VSYLLDTCTFLWIAVDSPELSPRCLEIARDRRSVLFLSAASAWEISVKFGLGRLVLPDPPRSYVPLLREEHGIETLPVDEESALAVADLPAVHRDPFDRILVGQALVHGLTILTPDKVIRRYPARTEW